MPLAKQSSSMDKARDCYNYFVPGLKLIANIGCHIMVLPLKSFVNVCVCPVDLW